jgi:uncharacterized membrane protein YqjE
MPAEASPAGGYLASLWTLLETLIASGQYRLELFSIEVQEEKLRCVQLFIWSGAAVLTGLLALTFASLTVVYLFWETARLAVLGSLAGVYLGATAVLVFALRRFLARQPKPFAMTVQELTRDRACIQPAP